MFLALKLLLFLGVLCYAVSAFVSSGFGDGFTLASSTNAVTSQIAAAKPCSSSSSSSNAPLHMLVSSRPAAQQHSSSSKRKSSALGAAVLPDNYPLTSVETMRRVYGPRRKWWGDLSAQQTRAFYHELLPVSLQFETGEFHSLTLEERARLASMARHAARLYARERCALPSRVTAALYDGFRHLKKYGTWSSTGQSWDEIWAKYEMQVRAAAPTADERAVREAVCKRILEKSCCTNQMFDALAGMAQGDAEQKRAEKEEAVRAMSSLVKRKVAQATRGITRPPLRLGGPMLRNRNDLMRV
jgi:hypothetical protein